ncbi:MAG: Clp protease ClpP [Acutalibacteraceae bacterium]|nr:Clp protease ClpP [Acutalibacteraceae bacterium]
MRIDIIGAIIPNDDKWIYDWFEMDSTSPKQINDALSTASGEDIDVYINSGGGDVFAGSEIYSAIRAYQGKVNIHIVGIAASAASVIACAGHSDISPTAMMMIHNVSAGAKGDYHAMDKESEILQKANEAVSAAYMEKCGISQQEALSMMDRESWLTATDAVELGLVDEIAAIKSIQLVAAESGILPRSVIDKLKNEIQGSAGKSAFCFENEKLKLLKLKGEIKNEI